MARNLKWCRLEDEVLRECEGLSLDAVCDAVNSLRRARGWSGWRSREAVGNRMRKLGVGYAKRKTV